MKTIIEEEDSIHHQHHKTSRENSSDEKHWRILESINDIIECGKTLFLVLLPHLAIIAVFFIYVFIGAAIIQEIEHVDTNANILSSSSSSIKSDEATTSATNSLMTSVVRVDHTYTLFDSYEETIVNKLNESLFTPSLQHDDGEEAGAAAHEMTTSEQEAKDIETIKFVSKIIRKFQQQQQHQNNSDLFRKLVKYFVEYKEDLKQKFYLNAIEVIKEENENFKLNIEANEMQVNEKPDEIVETKRHEWSFRNSIYFIGTLLTTIGYGDIVPQTTLGKIFSIIYSFIGIPLTVILLSDIGRLFTRFLKFLYAFFIHLYKNGYLNRIIHIPLRFFYVNSPSVYQATPVATRPSLYPTNDKSKSNDSSLIDTSDDSGINSSSYENQPGLIESVIDGAVSCFEQTNDEFDFPLSVLFCLLFSYLTLGAIICSHNSDWTLFDGYYFCFVTLTTVGFGDYVANEPFVWLFSCLYTLFGLAFFALTIDLLQVKIKLLLIKSGKNIICELFKLANQLGYKLDLDESYTSASIQSTATLLTSDQKPAEAKKSSSSSDDVFADQMPSYENSRFNKRKSLFFNKRTSILKDLNEFKLLNGFNPDVVKCDKQTQITTLLCSQYKIDMYPPIDTSSLQQETKPNILKLTNNAALNAINETSATVEGLTDNSLTNEIKSSDAQSEKYNPPEVTKPKVTEPTKSYPATATKPTAATATASTTATKTTAKPSSVVHPVKETTTTTATVVKRSSGANRFETSTSAQQPSRFNANVKK